MYVTSIYAVKLGLTCPPCYRWEFVTSLEFEVEVYTRKRPWRWSLLVYVAARLLALGAIITEFFGFDYPSEFNCSVWYRAVLVRRLVDPRYHAAHDLIRSSPLRQFCSLR